VKSIQFNSIQFNSIQFNSIQLLNSDLKKKGEIKEIYTNKLAGAAQAGAVVVDCQADSILLLVVVVGTAKDRQIDREITDD
jgi:hypothetical protein